MKDIFALAEEKRNDAQKNNLAESFKKESFTRVKLDKALATARTPLPQDPKVKELQDKINVAKTPVPIPAHIAYLRRSLELSKSQLGKKRLIGAQDIAWALINTPAFLFNH